MTPGRRRRWVMACTALLVAGCATTDRSDSRVARRPRFEPPQQPPGSLRLFIYRPQTLVGMWGRPVVVVNGQKMLSSLRESLLEPGSVFVVDAPADQTQVGWIQSRQTDVSAPLLTFSDLRGTPRYLRWTLKPTYGYLEQVDERVALEELGPLLYMGYRNLVDAK